MAYVLPPAEWIIGKNFNMFESMAIALEGRKLCSVLMKGELEMTANVFLVVRYCVATK
jgi:hypothetical protein